MFEKSKIRVTETCTMEGKNIDDHIDVLERIVSELVKTEREANVINTILVVVLFFSIIFVWLGR